MLGEPVKLAASKTCARKASGGLRRPIQSRVGSRASTACVHRDGIVETVNGLRPGRSSGIEQAHALVVPEEQGVPGIPIERVGRDRIGPRIGAADRIASAAELLPAARCARPKPCRPHDSATCAASTVAGTDGRDEKAPAFALHQHLLDQSEARAAAVPREDRRQTSRVPPCRRVLSRDRAVRHWAGGARAATRAPDKHAPSRRSSSRRHLNIRFHIA